MQTMNSPVFILLLFQFKGLKCLFEGGFCGKFGHYIHSTYFQGENWLLAIDLRNLRINCKYESVFSFGSGEVQTSPTQIEFKICGLRTDFMLGPRFRTFRYQ